ncbi:putative oligopeptide transporter [Colletotrichum trifolii]|uniref:Putative oligopeptide transporter n=1 Tax=Colletotrichum trifolii TaxID=5466 RepID=A0A4R8Q556_COLTR|nr:putative oligopeptide transporter [Colletotrichum trifolii]
MAPSRGHPDEGVPTPEGDRPAELRWGIQGHPPRIDPIIEGRSFTIRGVLVGLLVGLVICFSNMYFGLQTGWVSTMTMPASLMGFGTFKILSRHLEFPFSPVENVLVQTVAGSMAIMPLGCGFVGV